MTEDTAGNEGSSDSNNPALNDGAMPANIKMDYSSFLDDPMLAEFGWPVGDDLFSSIWADGPIVAT